MNNKPSSLKKDIERVLKPRFDISANVCAECGHDEWSHYWNGGLRPDLHSGWDTCKTDGCECVGDYEAGELKTKLDVQYDEKELEKATTQILNLIESVLPEKKKVKVPYNLLELQKAYENGWNACRADIKSKLNIGGEDD